MDDGIESAYFSQLDDNDKQRYKEKMTKLGLQTDPYLFSTDQWSPDRSLCPRVKYPDICVYLINSPILYTREALKAYKSSEGYAYFVAGFVEEVLVTKTSNGTLLMTAKVTLIIHLVPTIIKYCVTIGEA